MHIPDMEDCLLSFGQVKEESRQHRQQDVVRALRLLHVFACGKATDFRSSA